MFIDSQATLEPAASQPGSLAQEPAQQHSARQQPVQQQAVQQQRAQRHSAQRGQAQRGTAHQATAQLGRFGGFRLPQPLVPVAVVVALGAGLLPGLAARAEVQLRCDGSLLEARGSAEQRRPTRRLQLSLSLEAEAANSDGALAELQRRLAAVRTALQRLEVQEFRASSPSTWQRPAEAGRPALSQASLQVTGRLLPQRLQPLIREVGALAGVRLAPVSTEADPAQDAAVRRELLRRAYGDAQGQARELASVIGARRLRPLEVVLDGNEMRPMLMRAVAADAVVPPFDPAELSSPLERLSMLVRFCAE